MELTDKNYKSVRSDGIEVNEIIKSNGGCRTVWAILQPRQ